MICFCRSVWQLRKVSDSPGPALLLISVFFTILSLFVVVICEMHQIDLISWLGETYLFSVRNVAACMTRRTSLFCVFGTLTSTDLVGFCVSLDFQRH